MGTTNKIFINSLFPHENFKDRDLITLTIKISASLYLLYLPTPIRASLENNQKVNRQTFERKTRNRISVTTKSRLNI